MSNRESLKNWGIIFAVLIISGVLTVAWPIISNTLFGGSSVRISPTMETVTLNLPFPVAGMNSITLNSLQILLIMGALAGGLIVGTGIAIALGNVIISRLVTNTAESEDFQTRKTRLEQKEAEEIKRLREERKTARTSPERWRRWSAISTGIIFVVFALFAGYLLAYSFYPEGVIISGDNIVSVASIIIGAAVVLSALLVVLRLRADKLEALETTRTGAIPWDSIAVILTGILVVGLGIGIIVFINSGS